MAALFERTGDEWRSHDLAAKGQLFSPGSVPTVYFVPFRAQRTEQVALMVGDDRAVLVNGEPVLDVRVLEHEDEMLVDSQRFLFSAQSEAKLFSFQLEAGKRRPKCPVCRGAIEDGQVVCACPGCGRLHHQFEGKEHWTYRSECAFCSHPTGETHWQPPEEDDDDTC